MTKSIKISLLFLVLLASYSVASQKPNIVFILADDLGWADLPSYGNSFHETPYLDRLAEQSMRFSDAYAACPVCSPTRASIQSGQYPARVGVIDFIPGHWRPYEEVVVPKNRTQYLPGDIVTMAEALKTAGYRTGYFGKWHLGYEEDHLPSAQGYDESYVYAGGGHAAPRFIPELHPQPGRRLSKVLTDLSLDFMEKHQSEPFFLFLAHYDVHVQLDADRELIDKYLKKKSSGAYPGNAVYAAMVEHLDRSVGRVLQKLDELGLEENTMVVFFSDNGGLVTRGDKRCLLADNSRGVYADSPLKYIATSNLPLRGEKGTVYEGGVREPCMVRWPGKITAGAVSDVSVCSIDWYPTFLELAGATPPPEQVLDGVSILSELCGEIGLLDDRPLYWHYPVYHHDVPAAAVRKGDWKLVENLVNGQVSLYNLAVDAGESADLTSMAPDKVKELSSLLHAWQSDVRAEFPRPNPAFDSARRFEAGRHPDRH